MNWHETLIKADWPTTAIVLDFESYYDVDYSLSKMSQVEYIRDPRFQFTGLGVGLLTPDDEHHKSFFTGGPGVKWLIDTLKKRHGKNLHNVTVVTKNSKFDNQVLDYHFGLQPPFTIDIEDLSRYYDARMHRHSLENLAKKFHCSEEKGDTKQFKGFYWDDMSPEMRKSLGAYCRNDVELESELFHHLLPLIDNPEHELELMRHTLRMFLNPKIVLDFDEADSIIKGMEEERESAIQKAGYTATDLSGSISFATILKEYIPDLVPYTKVGKKPGKKITAIIGRPNRILALAKDDEGTKKLLEHPDPRVRNLIAGRQAVKSWPLHIKKIQAYIDQAEVQDGLVTMPLKYHGAGTGRWSGTGGKNPLNMGGKGRGKAIHPLIGRIRNAMVAPDGYTFGIVDSCQIEARLLAWIAGQTDLVEGFANGEDIYSVFASELFGTKVWKPAADDDSSEAKEASIKRGFGKDAILGCGYGMGKDTFYERCLSNDALRPMFDSGKYNKAFIKRLIDTYRSKYKDIVGFWGEMERCFANSIRYGGLAVHNPDSPISFHNMGDGTIHIELPSGRKLHYPHATISGGNIKYEHGKLYGAHLTENVVQAMSRCLLGEWILQCEKEVGPVVLHLYDEVVCLIPEDKAEEKLQQMIDLMSTGPAWTDGIPLAAEGQISKRYCK